MRVVISQSMYFPWVGFLEQLKLADVFVVYDDVPFSRGGFTNRVQAKTAAGSRWLTVPLRDVRLGQAIDEIQVDDRQDWRGNHRGTLQQAYARAPFFKQMIDIFEAGVSPTNTTLGGLALGTMRALMGCFGINPALRMLRASDLGVGGSGSRRVLDIVRALGGSEYVTGHGASNYLDHEAFEQAGVIVSYMRYGCQPYPQLHGPFTPYVSALDLVANCGTEGATYIQPTTVTWKQFNDGRG